MSERSRVQNEAFVRLAWQENERRGGYFSSWAVIKRLHLWFKAWTISDPKSITLKMEDRYNRDGLASTLSEHLSEYRLESDNG